MDTFAIRGWKRVVTKESPHAFWPPKSLEDELDELKNVRNKWLSITYQESLHNQFQSLFLDYLDNKVKWSVITPWFSETVRWLLNVLDVGEWDEVVCSPFADYALYDAIHRSWATIVVHDCKKKTGRVTPECIAACINDSTKIVFVTHHWWNALDLKKLRWLLWSATPLLVEDCSYAHWAMIHWTHVWVDWDISIFPLNYEKLIFTWQWCIVTTNNRLITDCLKDCYTYSFQMHWSRSDSGLWKKYHLSPLHAIVWKYSLRHVLHLRHWAKQCLEYFRKRMEVVSYCSFVEWVDTVWWTQQWSYHWFILHYYPEKLRKLPILWLIALLQAEWVEVEYAQDSIIECLNDKWEYKEYNASKVSKWLLFLPSFYDRYTHKDIIDQYIAAFRKIQLNLFC